MTNNDKKFLKVLKQDKDKVESIAREMDVSPLTSKILFNRGIEDKEKINKFLNPDYDDFHNPFLLNDMDIAVKRILKAIELDQRIWIYGDYDVDGVTSTSLLVTFFSQIGINVNYYIPNRHSEGYGLNKGALEYIKSKDGDLIITVDCGITSVEEANYAGEISIDMIITDHHTPSEKLPDALAVINPNRFDSEYPFKKLAGVGVAFKVVQAVSMQFKIEVDYLSLLPIVAIGTVADIVELMDENRLIVKKGLELIQKSPNLGIKALIEVTGLKDKEISSGHIGFVIGPRINAAGRMDSASIGVELLTSDSYERALEIARELDEENKKRQMVEADILEEAEKMVEENGMAEDNIIVLAKEGWHPGVIGIVSSRITEKYHRPSVLISIDDEKIGKASSRSIGPLNIYDALNQCKDLFLGFGGHSQAAGLSIEAQNIASFKERINKVVGNMLEPEDFIREITVDSIINVDDISIETVKQLDKLSPFGIGNPSPVFLFEDAIARDIRKVGKEKTHLKLGLIYKDIDIGSIGFNLGHLADEMENTDLLNIIGSLDINEYNNIRKVQILLKDIIVNSKDRRDLENLYYENINKNIVPGVQPYSENMELKDINKEDKLDYLYEKILGSKKVKLYINDLDNLNDIMKKIDKSGREIFKKINIIFNPKREEIVDSNEETILYDLPINKEIYDFIIKTHPNIELLYTDKDLNKNKKNMKKWTPTIEELRFIYKTFMKNKEVFKLDVYKYMNSLSESNLSKIKIDLALRIFKDIDLLDFKRVDERNYYIKLIKTNKKININKSSLLISLNDYIN